MPDGRTGKLLHNARRHGDLFPKQGDTHVGTITEKAPRCNKAQRPRLFMLHLTRGQESTPLDAFPSPEIEVAKLLGNWKLLNRQEVIAIDILDPQ